MALSPGERADLLRDYQRDVCAERGRLHGTKPQLANAIDAVDDAFDTVYPSLVAAIPVGIRTAMTPKQRAQFVYYVLRKRFEVL